MLLLRDYGQIGNNQKATSSLLLKKEKGTEALMMTIKWKWLLVPSMCIVSHQSSCLCLVATHFFFREECSLIFSFFFCIYVRFTTFFHGITLISPVAELVLAAQCVLPFFIS